MADNVVDLAKWRADHGLPEAPAASKVQLSALVQEIWSNNAWRRSQYQASIRALKAERERLNRDDTP